MDTEVKEFEVVAPTLTFGEAATPKTNEVPAVVAQDDQMTDSYQLTAEEQAQVDAFSQQIDIENTDAILTYGVGTQKKLSEFSENALSSVRTKDMGETGEMLSNLVGELKNFDVDENEKGLFSIFKKGANKLTNLQARYSKVETNVETIAAELDKHQAILLKDIKMLDKMYDANLTYFRELTMYIVAGKQKLEEVRNTKLKELQATAAQTGLPEDAQAAKDLAEKCDRFEKKIYDLELTRTISLQTAPQIRMIQNSDTLMSEKIQSTIVNTIPLWKNQMVIALGVEHANQAAAAQHAVSDATNELLRKNADKLKMATIESAKESERGIVDVETLKHTNEQLISTIDEVIKIQAEGKQKRAEAEKELVNIENQLKEKMLEASKAN
ncbi:MAG: toxic anion resistance protein [Lachnospiraceae bacterium]|nr:toxic anion resistance protein [Lachnospiraceae bacterium]MBQ1640061.1 toxic anion resistance protein [Lachnospiraceae bacterium]MBQ2466315.1 toxic anion resistance protein [Lachnospiraceae bacterium]MBQ2503333.1 toxic anion resistance protein [Lachnospiraceae bacterium]MBQ2578384.1 toxic anion resistance protein [Lachnospiraceae bacterium]